MNSNMEAIVIQILTKQLNGKETITADTCLYGSEGVLDSLGLVNLIADIEEIITEEYKVNIVLADERAMSQKHSPFRTVRSLSSYIDTLVKEK